MKNSFGFKFLYIVTVLVMIINVAFELHSSLFFDISDLPKGTLSSSVTSPDGKAVVNIYTLKNTIGSAVRGEAVTENNGKVSVRNIFWQTDLENADIKWANSHTAIINGVYINLYKGDTYDCRRGTSLFQEGALEGGAADSIAPEKVK